MHNTDTNPNALWTCPKHVAQMNRIIREIKADTNATEEEREMAQRSEASLAAHGLLEVTSRTIAANHNRLGEILIPFGSGGDEPFNPSMF